MPAQKLKEHLDGNEVKYITIGHSPAFTAPEIAESAHISDNLTNQNPARSQGAT